jgi:hypothetical protein
MTVHNLMEYSKYNSILENEEILSSQSSISTKDLTLESVGSEKVKSTGFEPEKAQSTGSESKKVGPDDFYLTLNSSRLIQTYTDPLEKTELHVIHPKHMTMLRLLTYF